MNINIKKISIFLLVALVLVFIDQFTKHLAIINFSGGKDLVLIDNILLLTYTENTGAAFGILKNMQSLFYIVTCIVLLLIIFILFRTEFSHHNIPFFIVLNLIFSGAIGNFIDRVKNSYVVDFIYFKLIDFPVFNFADICITFGCAIMIICMFTIYKEDI